MLMAWQSLTVKKYIVNELVYFVKMSIMVHKYKLQSDMSFEKSLILRDINIFILVPFIFYVDKFENLRVEFF